MRKRRRCTTSSTARVSLGGQNFFLFLILILILFSPNHQSGAERKRKRMIKSVPPCPSKVLLSYPVPPSVADMPCRCTHMQQALPVSAMSWRRAQRFLYCLELLCSVGIRNESLREACGSPSGWIRQPRRPALVLSVNNPTPATGLELPVAIAPTSWKTIVRCAAPLR